MSETGNRPGTGIPEATIRARLDSEIPEWERTAWEDCLRFRRLVLQGFAQLRSGLCETDREWAEGYRTEILHYLQEQP